jgi:DtxR family Mn-dependent transcriptional regulator
VYAEIMTNGKRVDGVTAAVEDYVKALYVLERDGGRVTTSALAARMHVSAPSATAMAKRLVELELAERAPYRGVVLTETGRRLGLEVLRHHRLLERFLSEVLDIPLDRVHEEADRLEHALSEAVEERIDAVLGFPGHDPHGDPIPSPELELAPAASRQLSGLAPGESSTVARVPDGDSGLLRYLLELGLAPGEPVELTLLAPFGGPVTVRTAAGEHAVSRELADAIGVV